MSSISDFRSKVVSNGFAKTARYRVNINTNISATLLNLAGNNLERLSYLCEQAELPGKNLNTTDVHYYGASFKSPNQSLYNTSQFTFLVTELMDEKKFFDAWIDYINGRQNGYDMNFRSDYSTTVDIITLKEIESIEDAGTMKVTLQDAFPLSVLSLPLSWGDDNFHRLQVEFAYTDYALG